MSFETWLAFVSATLVVVLVPGPTLLLIISYSLGQGWRAALPLAIGTVLGDFTAMTLSLFGVGALLMASASLFTAVKWLGAAYLVFLGVKLFRAPGVLHASEAGATVTGARMAGHAWLVTALNPKAITFFVAFVPQFIDRTQPFLDQALIVEATYLTMAFANALLFGLASSRARNLIANVASMKAINRTGGALLMGAGAAVVALRH